MVWKAIKRFVSDDYVTRPKDDSISFFKSLKKCKFAYKLLTPTDEEAHRGIDLQHLFRKDRKAATTFIKKMLSKGYKKENHYMAPEKGVITFDRTYNPKSLIQSWTEVFKVAALFAVDQPGNPRENFETVLEKIGASPAIPMVLTAKIDNNFFGNRELGNTVWTGPPEDEIYRLGGKIKCKATMPVAHIERLGVKV